MLRPIVIIAAIASGGCQQLGAPNSTTVPLYSTPADTTLILQRPITIAANRVKTYFQDGREVFVPNAYRPFCRFDIRSLTAQPRVVEPDQFDIISSGKVDGALTAQAAPLRLRLVSAFDESPRVYGVALRLRSAQQPDVHRLLCGQLRDPITSRRGLSLAQIRTALGETFTLRLPDDIL